MLGQIITAKVDVGSSFLPQERILELNRHLKKMSLHAQASRPDQEQI